MSKISIKKPRLRWLFGGIGFHNSEASMTALMSDRFKNEVALKTFREISPTYSRVFAGFADWTKEAMDAFADYYDETFRKAGTLIYMVPGRMPMMMDDFDMQAYCEKVASNLTYLVNERNCTKIRYYCVTNELSAGNTYAYLADKLDVFKNLHECLYKAFIKHGLDIGLLATDCSEEHNFHQIQWATENMDEITQMYCAHLYSTKYVPGDLNAYQYYIDIFTPLVIQAHSKEKRFVLGEYGITSSTKFSKMPMRNDVSYNVENPETDGIYAISLCEMAMAAINCGCFAAVMWTMLDYPDPFIRENGDTPEEKARYNAARFSGHGLEIRYNKNGLIKWCDEENDYTSREALYTMGYMAKLFKKGSRVLECNWEDRFIRCCGITCPDGSVSIAIINWEEKKKEVSIDLEHNLDKPVRKYEFIADSICFNKFNDLQNYSELIEPNNNEFKVVLPPKSIVFLTTDYVDRVPSEITGVKYSKGKLVWNKCRDEDHCYYRVYRKGEQVASTVAEYIYTDEKAEYKVYSVDKYGNCRAALRY